MSQATLLGICSDNVVTILTPSSTIECGPYADGVSTTTVAAGPSVDTLVFSLHSADQVLVTGSLQIMFTVVPAAWTTAPPLTYLQVLLGSDPATVINRYVIFHYYSGSYSPVPVDLQFTFLATGPTTVTVTPMNAGGPVTLQGSLWYQTAQI
jgi:hypothetical protein